MPGVIQRLPLAYLDLLGLKSSGDAPHVVQDDLSVSIDITSLYWANRFEFVAGSTTTGLAAGGYFPSSLAVPPGEMWIADGIQAQCNTVAGNTLNYARLAIWNARTGSPYRMTDPVMGVVGPLRWWSAQLVGPTIMMPDDVVGLVSDPNTWPTGQAAVFSARIVRLRI